MGIEMKGVNCLPVTIDEYLKDPVGYKAALDDQSLWSIVPLLNYTEMANLEEEQLVHFRGMVQDMTDNEMYLERSVICNSTTKKILRIESGKYREHVRLNANEFVDMSASVKKLGDCRAIEVVSPPGLNQWAKNCEAQFSTLSVNTEKSDVDERPTIDDLPLKKELEDMNQEINYDCKNPVCRVILYEDFESYPLNCLIDVLGFLSFGNANDDEAKVPRLHSIAVQKLPHYNPLLDIRLGDHGLNVSLDISSTHTELLQFLSLCLCKDELVAEYLLCNLISSVNADRDLNASVKFSLNIFNCNIEQIGYGKRLYEIIQLLVPTSDYLPIDDETMSTIKVYPRKDSEHNKIETGRLQLSAHTHLVVDNTLAREASWHKNNVRLALTRIIKEQIIICKFNYYEMSYDVNIPVLELSQYESTLLHDFCVPMETPDTSVSHEQSLAEARQYLNTANRLDKFRRYLTMVRSAVCGIDNMSKTIQEDYVAMRQKNSKIQPEHLNALIVLAKLLTVAHGKSELDRESWEHAKYLEMNRAERQNKLRVVQ